MSTSKKHVESRADADIARDVLRNLKADMDVPDDRVRAKVVKGVVTLTGAVARDGQKLASENCVWGIEGVSDVRNDIEVVPEALAAEA